jgi:hypothetical protein
VEDYGGHCHHWMCLGGCGCHHWMCRDGGDGRVVSMVVRCVEVLVAVSIVNT